MKVKELIKLLEMQNGDDIVVVDGYETGFDTLKKIQIVFMKKNKNKNTWDGELKQKHMGWGIFGE